ncbi:OmpH family outer membrane protein [Lentibacter algarum]|uniref:OmpH family outer membrane protein n=1 Tax=Lentibacter algarum TaxID=576131 RepID=UPI001C0A3977|nr:OmpH family outer membrane protein [Lentibacter algarum]MBU2982480.1 OmpH family outer membrane protein [Lentibacter algarum]
MFELRRYLGAVATLVFTVWAAVVAAQSLGTEQAEVVIVDPNRLFAETLFGKRINDELEAESNALALENRRIEEELRSEEKTLTEARKTMTAEDFRDSADAFDIKVQGIRRERVEKLRALDEKRANALQRFLATAQGVLVTLMRERGATVLLDLRTVILRDGAIDITVDAVAKIDEAIGTGENIDFDEAPLQAPQPELQQEPQPEPEPEPQTEPQD